MLGHDLRSILYLGSCLPRDRWVVSFISLDIRIHFVSIATGIQSREQNISQSHRRSQACMISIIRSMTYLRSRSYLLLDRILRFNGYSCLLLHAIGTQSRENRSVIQNIVSILGYELRSILDLREYRWIVSFISIDIRFSCKYCNGYPEQTVEHQLHKSSYPCLDTIYCTMYDVHVSQIVSIIVGLYLSFQWVARTI